MAAATGAALAAAAASAYGANRQASAARDAARQASKPRSGWSTTNRTFGTGRAGTLASEYLLRGEQNYQRRMRRHARGLDRPPAPISAPSYTPRGPSSRTTGILDAILGRATGPNPLLFNGEQYANRLMQGDKDVNPFLSSAFDAARSPSRGRLQLDRFIERGGSLEARPYQDILIRSIMGRPTPSPRDRYRGDRGELLDTEPSLSDEPRFGLRHRRPRTTTTLSYY